mmetsp:Transcript_49786/g.116383  ORF Transcript_49786/g.116383 Transcript_49786/m.116383 type:complete len:226 (+) Transcript_49786:367-1044(+)
MQRQRQGPCDHRCSVRCALALGVVPPYGSPQERQEPWTVRGARGDCWGAACHNLATDGYCGHASHRLGGTSEVYVAECANAHPRFAAVEGELCRQHLSTWALHVQAVLAIACCVVHLFDPLSQSCLATRRALLQAYVDTSSSTCCVAFSVVHHCCNHSAGTIAVQGSSEQEVDAAWSVNHMLGVRRAQSYASGWCACLLFRTSALSCVHCCYCLAAANTNADGRC